MYEIEIRDDDLKAGEDFALKESPLPRTKCFTSCAEVISLAVAADSLGGGVRLYYNKNDNTTLKLPIASMVESKMAVANGATQA